MGPQLFAHPAAAEIDEQSAGDGVGPGNDRAAAQEPMAGSVHLEERLLHRVLRRASAAGPSQGEAVQARRQLVVQLDERRLVAAGIPLHGAVRARRAYGVDVASAVRHERNLAHHCLHGDLAARNTHAGPSGYRR